MLNCCLSLSFPSLLDPLTVTHTVICGRLGTHYLHRGQKCGFICLKVICDDWTYFCKYLITVVASVLTAMRATAAAISYEHQLCEMEDHSREVVQRTQHLSADAPTHCTPTGSQTDICVHIGCLKHKQGQSQWMSIYPHYGQVILLPLKYSLLFLQL